MITHCSFPGLSVMPAFSGTDDAYLKISGPSVSLQIPGEKTMYSEQGLMWSADPGSRYVLAVLPE